MTLPELRKLYFNPSIYKTRNKNSKMTESLPNLAEQQKQVELYRQVRQRHHAEYISAGLLDKVLDLDADQQFSGTYRQYFTNRLQLQSDTFRVMETTSSGLIRNCLGANVDRLSLMFLFSCDCNQACMDSGEQFLGSAPMLTRAHGTEGEIYSIKKGLSKTDAELIAQNADEIIALRESGRLSYPVCASDLLTW